MHCVYYAPEVGGLESHIQFLCRGLVARGHEVDVVTSRSRPGLPTSEVMDGVRVCRTWMPSRNSVGWAAHSLGSIPRFGALAEAADVLHAQDIVLELRGGLKVDEWSGGPALASLYDWLTRQLVKANIDRDPSVTQQCLTLVTGLADTWREAAALNSMAGRRAG